MAHDVQCVALRQLETALRLYFEQEDYYSVITLAGAAEEILGNLLKENGSEHELDSIKKYTAEVRDVLWPEDSESEKIEELLRKLLEAKEDGVAISHDCIKKVATAITEHLSPGDPIEANEVNKIGNILRSRLNKKDHDIRNPKDFLKEIVRANTESYALKLANNARDTLKHWYPGQPKRIEFDAKEEAEDMLERAIDNYSTLTGNMTPAMNRFQGMHVHDNKQIPPYPRP